MRVDAVMPIVRIAMIKGGNGDHGHEGEGEQADEGRSDRRLGIDPPSERGKRAPGPGKGG